VVRLTEGERKADVCFRRTGVPTVSAPGVANWRPCLDVLRALGAKTVRLAFDADAWAKPAVARALRACRDGLAGAGFAVELERWDPACGKGLDDLLAAGHAPDVLSGEAVDRAVAEAVGAAGESASPASGTGDDVLAVVEAGGPAALFADPAALDRLARLAAVDSAAYGAVRARLRGVVSVRDLDAALRTRVERARRDAPPADPPAAEAPAYRVEGGALCRV
jgi:hypothetical protein